MEQVHDAILLQWTMTSRSYSHGGETRKINKRS